MSKKNITLAIQNLNYLTRRFRKVNSPIFWIFLDENRLENYENFIAQIPSKIKVGIIFRIKNKKLRYNKAKRVLKMCKKRHFPFVVADDPQLALTLGAYGTHLSKQVIYTRKYNKLKYSCSAHGYNDMRRINNLKVNYAFISPLFKTTSSKLKKPLGLTLLGLVSEYISCKYGVLGGISLKNIRSLRSRNMNTLGGLSYILEILEK